MKNTKHTPGPWKVQWNNCPGQEIFTVVDSDDQFVTSFTKQHAFDPTEANARLIAAAPELLTKCHALLEILVNKVDRQPNFYRDKLIAELREAIAKAEGES